MMQETKRVFGVHLTDAGFEGACVALVAKGKAEAIAQDVIERYK
jgi:galactokinase